MMHCIIGANILDRIVKCPGSVKPGNGSLAQHDYLNKGYTQNRIECNKAVVRGLAIDELAKNIIRVKSGMSEKSQHFCTPEDEVDPTYYKPANLYASHMVKVANKVGKSFIDPMYDCSRYVKNLENCEFRVRFNPDFVAMPYTEKGTAFISELNTASNDDRNKMFQVICCAVGLIEYYPTIDGCMCEVFNPILEEVSVVKLSRAEIEAYRDDIIKPALDKLRDALDSDHVEEYRHNCSWCRHYCIFKDEGCQACRNSDEYIENTIDIDLNFKLCGVTREILDFYNSMF